METFISKLLEWLWDVSERYILPFCIVRSYERGVLLLLGKYHKNLKVGVNWKFPLIHESLTCMVMPETMETRAFTVTTGDKQTITMSLIGTYIVTDEKKFLLEANDAATNIAHHLISVGSDFICEYDWEELKDKRSYTPIKKKLNDAIEYTGAKFTVISYGSMCKSTPIALINS